MNHKSFRDSSHLQTSKHFKPTLSHILLCSLSGRILLLLAAGPRCVRQFPDSPYKTAQSSLSATMDQSENTPDTTHHSTLLARNKSRIYFILASVDPLNKGHILGPVILVLSREVSLFRDHFLHSVYGKLLFGLSFDGRGSFIRVSL